MHLLPGTSCSTYVMMTRGCMHAPLPLSIKKVMSMQCVCMHPLAIIIKILVNPPYASRVNMLSYHRSPSASLRTEADSIARHLWPLAL